MSTLGATSAAVFRPQLAAVAIFGSGMVTFGVFLSGFVIAEPAPYEVFMAALIGLWFLFGLKISRAVAPLLALFILFITGGLLSLTVMRDLASNNNNTLLYLMNMTSDYKIAAANGTELELQLIEDEQGLRNITSHRPNTEMYLTLTLTPEVQPLPVGSYVITYSVIDEISGESFELEKDITVAERE